MHSTKRYFLNEHKNTIALYPKEIQEKIYTIQWNNVIHYYLGDNKIQKFKNYLEEVGFGKIDYHEYHFLLNNMESIRLNNPEKQAKKDREIEVEKKERLFLLENKSLNKELENLSHQKKWYSETYDHLPLWFLKVGSIFRRLR
jgi:hypothetical protein